MPPSVRRDKTVLVVDDDPVSLRATARSLGLAGLTVLSTSDARQAQQLYARHAPDVVVLDVTMRGTSGPELAEKLDGGVPIVFYSGVDPMELAELASRVPGARSVAKGDGGTALVRAVRAAVAGARRSTQRLRAVRLPESTAYSISHGRSRKK